jgi:hypothetical protein
MYRCKTKGTITEGAILAALRNYLRLRGWYVIRHQQSMGSHKGLSDLTAIKDGITVYLETKRPGGRLSPVQEQFRMAIEGHGGIYRVVASYEEVITVVDDLERRAQ